MKRLFASSVALAAAALARPAETRWPGVTDQVKRDKLNADALTLVSRYGHLLGNRSLPPAELCRRSTQRRRARQTHPGKRGKR